MTNINKFEESNLISILYCLYQFDELKKEIINQVNNNKDNLVNSIINFFKNNQNQGIIGLSNNFNKYNYKNAILVLFKELTKNLNKIQNTFDLYNLSNQNEEILKVKEFLAKNQYGSIIENSFYYIKELKYYCSVQNKADYKFEIHPFISVELNDSNKIQKFSNLFNPEIKYEKCKFCGNTNNKCFVENKIISIPKILIIVLDGVNNFNFDNKWMISHDNFKYNLKCFINKNKIIYYKKDFYFYQYNENYSSTKVDTFDKLSPRVLFYKIFKMNNEINNNNGNNEQNINNMNSKNYNKFMNNNMNNNINCNNLNNMNNCNMNNNMNNNNMNDSNMNNCNMNNSNMNNCNMNNNMNNSNMNNNMNNFNMNNDINNYNMNNNMIHGNMNNFNMNIFNMNNNMINSNMNSANMNNNNISNQSNNNNCLTNNINYMSNNESFNKMNNNNNQNPPNKQINNNLIFVTFTFVKYNKQIFLDISENMLFKDVIDQLEEKYSWLKSIKNKYYYFENKKIDFNQTVKNLKIKNNSDIIIRI